MKEAYLSQTACLSVILLKLKTSLMALRNNVPSKQQSRYTLVLPRPCTAAPHSLQIGKAINSSSQLTLTLNILNVAEKLKINSRIFVQKLTDFFVSQGQKKVFRAHWN